VPAKVPVHVPAEHVAFVTVSQETRKSWAPYGTILASTWSSPVSVVRYIGDPLGVEALPRNDTATWWVDHFDVTDQPRPEESAGSLKATRPLTSRA